MKKKIFIFIPLVIAILFIFNLSVFADSAGVDVFLGSTKNVKAGDTAALTLEVRIEGGKDIQGVQIDFGFSENFPEKMNFEILSNTTGWQNIGITQNNLLAFGDIVRENAVIAAKITFTVPEDVPGGTKYVFTPVYAVGATAVQEIEANLHSEFAEIAVSGNNTSGGDVSSAISPENDKVDTDEDKLRDEASGENPAGNGEEADEENNGRETDTQAPQWKNPFSDVDSEDWFFESVKFVCEEELMSGVGEGIFSPDANLTRGMLVTILYRLEGSPQSGTYGFPDVPRNIWYTQSVDWAASNGIVNGVGDNRFAPDSPVTREQIAVIFYNYAKFHSYNLSVSKDLSVFSDSLDVSQWADTAMRWAVSAGIISGKGGNKLDAGGNASRAEAATMIKRFMEKF